jgi:CPA2 family monovalent cation:H+ antiporter-2
VAEVVLPELEGSLELARQALMRLQVPPTEVHRYTDRIRQELYAHLYDGGDGYRMLSQLRGVEQQFDLQWVKLDPNSTISNRSIGQSEIRKQTGASVVAVVRNGKLTPNPDADFVLMPDDLVAIIGNDKHREAFCFISSKTECNKQQDTPSKNFQIS